MTNKMNVSPQNWGLELRDIFEGLNPNSVELSFVYNEYGDELVRLCEKFGIDYEITIDEEDNEKWIDILIWTKPTNK